MIQANVPWVESPFFEEELEKKNLSAEQKKLVQDYHNDGYVVISGLVPESLIDRTREDVETKAFNPDFEIKTHRDHSRIQDFWMVSDASKELAIFPKILDMLELLYGREPVPFQTLNFRVGSQQRAHSDTIHFSSLPARFMCGVWVALEDITEENGPVFYHPGSHRLPEYDFTQIKETAHDTSYDDYKDYEDFIEKIVQVNNFPKRKFLAKKGDVLIWSSNIIHGGSPVTKEGSTRYSQVTHYFFKDCYYYTPMLSNMVTKELYLRTSLVNIKTGEKVEQTYNGKKLNYISTGNNLFILNDRLKPVPKSLKFLGKVF
ncbi:phytanoyl-CoA dioxygenase family protein [Aridibaculum aurantiacum]|uniref:phytanoyl-CoA dioxygenase family protein n=1 Tax=Aridibaculum aurantiacum TaxID=2810307 RepID=UPI001A9591BC|nr:phytanoyl-CoA dioxygenase family protein [Aridibaculum aurantiacum]